MTAIDTAHGVSEAFLAHLDQLARDEGGIWWRDVLLRDDLFIAVRRKSLNVYYRGGSLYRIDEKDDGTASPKTHVKYLLRQQQVLAELKDHEFQLPTVGKSKQQREIVWKRYKSEVTLRDMIRSASDLAGVEKAGLHPLVVGNSHVIDVEVSLERAGETDPIEPEVTVDDHDAEQKKRFQDRIDVTTLERQEDAIAVVFHEAKHFTNPALRAKTREPDVIGQVRRYQEAIARHEGPLLERYKATCRAHQRLGAMRWRVRAEHGKSTRELNQLIRDVAEGTAKLIIDPNPRLVIFGFDADQKDGRLDKNREALGKFAPGLSIYAVGNPTTETRAFPPK